MLDELERHASFLTNRYSPFQAPQYTRISRDAGVGAVLGREIMAQVRLIRNGTLDEDSPLYPR